MAVCQVTIGRRGCHQVSQNVTDPVNYQREEPMPQSGRVTQVTLSCNQ